MVWKHEVECPQFKIKTLYEGFSCPHFRYRHRPIPPRYRLENHPKYLSEFEIMKMLYTLTGDEWEYHNNTSPYDKPKWEELGIVRAYYKWIADVNDLSYMDGDFTLPENIDDLMLIPHAHARNRDSILNSGDTTPNKYASYSIWHRKGAKLVDPRTLRYKFLIPILPRLER